MATREFIGYTIIMETKQLKILLEGPDCSGKSTICEKLRVLYPDVEIVDRSIISDIVYAHKFKRQEYLGIPIDLYLNYWLHWHKNNRKSKIVLFTASPEVLAQRAMEKNEDFCRNRTFEQVVEHLDTDRQAFAYHTTKASELFGFPVLDINTETNDIDFNLQMIGDFIDVEL